MSQKYKVYINNTLKIITDNWEDFCSNYTLIEAAGGVVYNIDNQLLMIFRNANWDLPKGKIEGGETSQECAIREVGEECGVFGLRIIDQLPETYHTYLEGDKNILKLTYWFKMITDFNKELVPQHEEGISMACWVDHSQIDNKLKNSFGNIKQLLRNE